jgi:hypothetical protein
MAETLVGAVRVNHIEPGASIRLADSVEAIPIGRGVTLEQAAGIRAHVPAVLRTGQGFWLRITVHSSQGLAAGAVVNLRVLGMAAEIRPTALKLRTDASEQCPGIAEGVLEVLRGKGDGQLSVQVGTLTEMVPLHVE